MKTGYKTGAIVGTILLLGAGQIFAARAGWRGGSGRGRGYSPGVPARARAGGRFAGPMRERPNGPGRATMFSGGVRRLNLPEEQRGRVRDIVAEAATEGLAAREKLADAQRKLRDLVADGASEDQINAAGQDLGKALAQETLRRAKTRASVKEVLPRDQLERLAQVKSRAGQFRAGRGHAPGRGRLGGRGAGAWGQRPGWSPRMQPRGWQGRASLNQRGQRGSAEAPRPQRSGPAFEGRPWGGPDQRGARRPQMGPGRPGGPDELPGDRPTLPGRGPAPLKRMFERADTDNDGTLSMEEVEAFQDRMKDRPGLPGR